LLLILLRKAAAQARDAKFYHVLASIFKATAKPLDSSQSNGHDFCRGENGLRIIVKLNSRELAMLR